MHLAHIAPLETHRVELQAELDRLCDTEAFRACDRRVPSLMLDPYMTSYGEYRDKSHSIWINPLNQRRHQVLATMAHEVAHAMGHPYQLMARGTHGKSARDRRTGDLDHRRRWERNFLELIRERWGRTPRIRWDDFRTRRAAIDVAVEDMIWVELRRKGEQR